jgi:hypothetical protein
MLTNISVALLMHRALRLADRNFTRNFSDYHGQPREIIKKGLGRPHAAGQDQLPNASLVA